MAKKKKNAKPQNKEFGSDPFSNLKGFAVSDLQPEKKECLDLPVVDPKSHQYGSFNEEMAKLGVEKINVEDDIQDSLSVPEENVLPVRKAEPCLSEDEQFLQAMGELPANFTDQVPEENDPPSASARRMKQLKQGKLSPDASLDLHGLTRADVAGRLRFFLQNATRNEWRTVLVITGRGLHSADGEPVLRKEAESFLSSEGRKSVVEWSRAPKQYGGSGALVLFLRNLPK